MMDYEALVRFAITAREILERLDTRLRWVEIILAFLAGTVVILSVFAFLAWRALESQGVKVAW